jgi:hypothetical protein
MKAVKAVKAPNGERKKLRTVTFRITDKQHRALSAYTIRLSQRSRSPMSKNSAMQHLLDNLPARS